MKLRWNLYIWSYYVAACVYFERSSEVENVVDWRNNETNITDIK